MVLCYRYPLRVVPDRGKVARHFYLHIKQLRDRGRRCNLEWCSSLLLRAVPVEGLSLNHGQPTLPAARGTWLSVQHRDVCGTSQYPPQVAWVRLLSCYKTSLKPQCRIYCLHLRCASKKQQTRDYAQTKVRQFRGKRSRLWNPVFNEPLNNAEFL